MAWGRAPPTPGVAAGVNCAVGGTHVVVPIGIDAAPILNERELLEMSVKATSAT
jgi:hypothetical protein